MCDSPVSNDCGIPTAIRTMRYSCGAPFHYQFDGPKGYYRIWMYFVNPINEARTFDVRINGRTVLSGFRPFPLNTGILKQFDNIAAADGRIDVTFRSIVDACLVSAIEVEQVSTTTPPKPTAKPRPAPGTLTRTSHDDLTISYYGAWTADSNGHHSDVAGNAMDFTFKGPIIRWIGSRNSAHGIAEVYLDGVLQQRMDTFASQPTSGQVLYEKTGLSTSKYHTLRILVTNDRHPNSTGYLQDVNALQCQEPFDAAESDAEAAYKEVEVIEAGKKPYLASSDWHPVPNVGEAPETGVILHEGVFLTAFNRNIDYQIKNWDMTAGWVSWLPGANEGRRMLGAANILRWTDNPTLQNNLSRLVESVGGRQLADGYALPYPNSDMGKTVYGANNERAAYDRRNFTLGLLAAGRVIPSANRIARRFQDWLYSSPYVNTMLDSALGIQGEQPAVSVYFSPVGKGDDLVCHERFWRQDWWLAQLKDQQPGCISRFPLSRPHSYVLTPWISYCDAYRATGDQRYIEAMLRAWEICRDSFIHVGGSAAICEDCDNAYPYQSYYLKKHTGENCGGVFWIDFNHRLLQLYPDQERFACEIERTLYNVTLANQETSGDIRYHTNLVGTKVRATHESTCCEVTNSWLLARLPEFIYSVTTDGLYVNLFSPSSITWNKGGSKVTLDMSTEFPDSTRVLMTVWVGTPLSMKIRLRMPSWATGNASISVNGRNVTTGAPGTFVTLERTWSNSDTISFKIPVGFRLTKYTGFDRDAHYDRYALEYGPVLMSLVGAADLNITSGHLIGSLSPIRGAPLQFNVTGHPDCRYTPYWQIERETFTCFPTLR